MFEVICDFTALAGAHVSEELDKEFQYQMNLTDGEWLFWQESQFLGHSLAPVKDATGQAILQYFAHCACPFSMLRLGRSLSERSEEHGPVTSDIMAIKYLLGGLEVVQNNLYDHRVREGMELLISSLEFRLACELLITYDTELNKRVICPEIMALIKGVVSGEPTEPKYN
ncbi:hypothetical protein [Pseudoalteromonas ruthenica]|uniref:hypothetical protein n=1 Tax=Pseudoalteromonas ruthenica TaxID=151081 RepID=UPI00241CC56A|nr:hypothetical protein [Pseudoalteromonas ruthenica]